MPEVGNCPICPCLNMALTTKQTIIQKTIRCAMRHDAYLYNINIIPNNRYQRMQYK
jgi:hypothetical protein